MYYTIGDATYWYEVHGEGIPLVLLHGFTGSSATWRPLIPYFADTFQLVAVDLPGHGKTRCTTPRDMETVGEDLATLCRFLGIDSFHLLGYSMGGRTALSFAIRHPEMIRSLILESASPGLREEEERKQRRKNDEALAEKIIQGGIEEFVNEWENIPLFQSQKKLPAEVRERIRRERLEQDAYGLAMSLKYMGTGKQPSYWEQLSRFAKPVLLICGEEDKKFVQLNEKMNTLFPFSKLKICEKAGHAIHVENPDIFGKLVTEFIFEKEAKHNEEENDDCTMAKG
ncbi:MAG TPA: 2-succinyl-6-hydroxy-2,4-cyclohexadiene-1-carboxylate synthase [Bacillota bacterium]|nr:2-succinyl-6-hydroxy-2,4-cyclohexadiene-1-carboxylate synthase [Bacillota bacterium]